MQVSKKPLPNEIYEKMFDVLYNLLGKKKSKKDFINIINDLLSYKEQIMIVKRIAILYLVTKEVGVMEISRILRVSKSTASKFLVMFKEDRYLAKHFKTLVKREKLIGILDDIYRELISPPTKFGSNWETGWRIEIDRQRKYTSLI